MHSVGRISHFSSSSFLTCLRPYLSSRLSSTSLRATTMANTSAPPTEEQPWHATFPSPKSVATPVSREQMRSWLTEGKVPGKDFVLVDLRRNDYNVCLRWILTMKMRVAASFYEGVIILNRTDNTRAERYVDPSTSQRNLSTPTFRNCSTYSPRRESRRSFGIVVSYSQWYW
jgi:hypothetical protein